MYVCGPTVYNYIHIGNARLTIVYDTVRKYLEYKGYDVHYVSNFTDVDDKLIKAANELGEEVLNIAERFIKAYFEDVGSLGCSKADCHPRVTENMDDIIDFIQTLIDKGYAYEADGDVYYKTRSFKDYGKLSHQSIDELRSGARIQVGEKKKTRSTSHYGNPPKKTKSLGRAHGAKAVRAGTLNALPWQENIWGIQSIFMPHGQDLTFPHHENEIAQSEALTGKPFAKYWLHNGYINIDNEKMSKSLGNFVLVHDIIKEHDPQVLRFFMLSVHYRHPINYSVELLENTKNAFGRLKTAYSNLRHRLKSSTNLTEGDSEWLEKIEEQRKAFETAMDDDFNTANAISVLFDLAKHANYYLQEKNTAEHVIQAFLNLFDEICSVLGFSLQEQELLDAEIEELIEKRNEARRNRDFATSDQIRDQLKSMNIILEDTPQGTRWKRGES